MNLPKGWMEGNITLEDHRGEIRQTNKNLKIVQKVHWDTSHMIQHHIDHVLRFLTTQFNLLIND